MKKVSRRSFLKNTTYMGAAATLGINPVFAHTKKKTKVPTIYSKKKAVVIGSGFGGSVAALRLGEAGIPTLLIERGQYWAYDGPGSFPTIANTAGDGRTTWLDTVDGQSGTIPVPKYTGMIERIKGDNTNGICAAALGGGSLVYGGVLLKPKQALFEKVLPTIDYDEMERKYYPKVLRMISGGQIPDDILNAPNYAAKRRFIEDATQGGLDVVKSDVGFNWNVIRQEINGELDPAASIGEYLYGCNSGAKNTLDRNYIARAIRTGHVEVFTLHNVMTIRQQRYQGKYSIYCDMLDEFGEVKQRHIIRCDYVFMAAGSLNTTKLLLKAKSNGDLPNINDEVGQSWGTNGDELMGRFIFDPNIHGAQGGPASIAAYDMNAIKPVTFMHSPANFAIPPPARLEFQLAMSVPDQLGHLSYDADTDKPFIHWPKSENESDAAAHQLSLQKLIHGSDFIRSIGATSVWHPLGGAVMSKACNNVGEVYGQENLFVVDGSLLPGSAGGVNPALTIAANAERIMETLIPKLKGGIHHDHHCKEDENDPD